MTNNTLQLTKQEQEELGEKHLEMLREKGVEIETIEKPTIDIFTISIHDTSTFTKVFETIKKFNNEVKIEVTPDYLRVMLLDPATVAMVQFKISEPIISYDKDLVQQEPYVFYVNVNTLLSAVVLGGEKPTNKLHIEKDALVCESLHTDVDKCLVTSIALLDLEVENRKFLELDKPMACFDIDTGLFANAIYEADKKCVSQSVNLHFHEDTMVLIYQTSDHKDLYSKYYVPTIAVHKSAEDMLDELKSEDLEFSPPSYLLNTYSAEYLKKVFMKKYGFPALFGRCTLSMCDQHPLFLHGEVDGLVLDYVLAPRIHSDEDNPACVVVEGYDIAGDIRLLKKKSEENVDEGDEV